MVLLHQQYVASFHARRDGSATRNPLLTSISVPTICFSLVTLYLTLTLSHQTIPLVAGLASLDWLGTTTILGATILLLVGLQLGSTTSFVAPKVVVLIIFGGLLSFAFPLTQGWQERRGRSPIMPLRIFKDVSNLSALAVCACDALAFNSVAYFLPMYLQIVLGLNPSKTGVYMLALAIPLATVSLGSGYLMERSGRFLEVLQGGLLIMTIGIGLFICLHANQQVGKIAVFMVIVGVGFGPNFAAPLIALQTRIRVSDIATGTAAFGFVRMISGAIGVIIGQVIFQLLMTKQSDRFVEAGISQQFAQQLAHGEAIFLSREVAAFPEDQKIVARHAMTTAIRGAWVFYTVISGAGLLCSFGIKRKKLQHGPDEGIEHPEGRQEGAGSRVAIAPKGNKR